MFTGRVFLMVGDNWRIRIRVTKMNISTTALLLYSRTSHGDFKYRQYLMF